VTPTAGAVQVRVAESEHDLATARGLEHDVFLAEGFIAPSARRVVEEYEHLDAQSRWYLAERDGEPAGVLRVMAPAPRPVPAVHSFALHPDAREELGRHRYTEVGTLAVTETHRGTDTGMHLYRAAFGDAVRAGTTAWVAVLEQWLIEHMASFGLPFAPMGDGRYYMGGECLPVVLDFENALATLHRTDAALHAWMTEGLPVGAPA
jgi:hypothetical protein